jgi:two-component system, OmpR family, response regulator ResD
MPSREKRILVVEDDDAIRALLFTVLRRRGFKVDTSPNGADGLQRLRSCAYSLVLLDLMMPVMTGYEFLGQLERQDPPSRPLVIVLSAGGSTRNLNPQTVAGTIRKPFDIELLVDTVSACLSAQDAIAQDDNCPAADSDGPEPSGAGKEPN